MRNKIKMFAAAILAVGIVLTVNPVQVKAMYSCSQDIINDANAKIAAATVQYQAAQQAEAAALANLNAVKAAGGTELEVTVAANAYTTAKNVTKWSLDQVNNAKAYLENITQRANQETALQNEYAYLGNLTNMQGAKLEAESAQAVAVNVAEQIKAVQAAIASYQQMALTTPSVQPQVNELNAKLVALQAEYAAKKAVADQKAANYAAVVAADNYAQYSGGAWINYWNHRDDVRDRHLTNCACELCEANRRAAGIYPPEENK